MFGLGLSFKAWRLDLDHKIWQSVHLWNQATRQTLEVAMPRSVGVDCNRILRFSFLPWVKNLWKT